MRDFAFRLGGSMRSYLSRVACVAAGAEGLCFMAYHTTVFPVSYSHRPCTSIAHFFTKEKNKGTATTLNSSRLRGLGKGASARCGGESGAERNP
jgi:hypothetical protein